MDLYQHQLDYVFNRPVEEPAWYWQSREEEYPFGEEDDTMTAFQFFENLCWQPGRDLASYTDGQVGLGLAYLFDGNTCDLVHGFKNAPVPQKRKVASLLALFTLFEEVFEPRCARVMSSASKEKSPPLSHICYMFWDVTPLATWIRFDHPDQISMAILAQQNDEETRAYYRAIANVMERCIRLRNPACIESGLHGLGHLVPFQKDIAVSILDRFLKNAQQHDVQLLHYAKAARTGMIL